ncbi:MAG: Gfo/Idh/MocA family protein [Alphaproteobacteria bacterium]
MKIGMIGTSIISDQFADALGQISTFTKALVYSRNLHKAQEKQELWATEEATDDFDVFLSSDIDVAYIASPNSLHFEQLMACLKAGKNVICEKPMILSLEDFDAAYALADEKGLFLFEAFRHINSPNFTRLKEAIGEIGAIRYAHLVYGQHSSKYAAYKRGENPNIFNPEFKGGALNDLGVYPIAVAVGLFGQWKSLTYKKICLDNGVDALGTIILEYNDFLCNIAFSKVSDSQNISEISGEEGGIVISRVGVLEGLYINGQSESQNMLENDMVYEAQNFLNIMQLNNQESYHALREISRLTCKVISEAKNL